MIGAGRATSAATVRRFGGNKFPLLVKAGHTVTITVLSRSASLYYAIAGGGVLTQTRVSDGRRKITFIACKGTRNLSRADGARVTFWSGFVLVARPMCVRAARMDRPRAARRASARIALGPPLLAVWSKREQVRAAHAQPDVADRAQPAP